MYINAEYHGGHWTPTLKYPHDSRTPFSSFVSFTPPIFLHWNFNDLTEILNYSIISQHKVAFIS